MSVSEVAFDGEFVHRCRFFEAMHRRTCGERLLGRRVQWRCAGGTEATGQSDYTSGDDLRYVDWNRAARLDELVTRQYRGASRGPVYLLLDASASMSLGEPSKWNAAKRLAAVLGYLTLAGHDTLEVTAFAETASAKLEPGSGDRVTELFQFLTQLPAASGQANLGAACDQLTGQRPPGLVLLLSDLLDLSEFAPALDGLRHWQFEPFLIQVACRDDLSPEHVGSVGLRDVESDKASRYPIDVVDLLNYRRVVQRHQAMLGGYCSRYEIGLARLMVEQSLEQQMETIFRCAMQRARSASAAGV